MITFETIGKLESATLKEGDLVQVLGEFSEGDVALMTGKVYPALHDSSNRLVTIANGLKVEVFPTPLGDKDVTKKYVNERDDKIKEQVNNLHTKREAIEWRSGLRVTDALQLYVHDGIEYLPDSKAVPFNTGATFNSDNWVLSELVTKTVAQSLIDNSILKSYGDIKSALFNGFSTAKNNCHLASSMQGSYYFESGTYDFSGCVIPAGVRIYLADNALIKCSTGTLDVRAEIWSDHYPFMRESNGSINLHSIDITTNRPEQIDNMIPPRQWQRFNITILDGTYGDIQLNDKWAASSTIGAVAGERAGVYIFGQSKLGTTVKSILCVSCGGASFTPMFNQMTVNGWNNKTNEKESVAFYGCQSAAIDAVYFAADGADKAIMSYGSNVDVENESFKDGAYLDLYVTKHNGKISSNSSTILSIGTSPKGTARRYVSNPIGSGCAISIMDRSGLFGDDYNSLRTTGAANGMTFLASERSLAGVRFFTDSLSSYQTYFTSDNDFSTENTGDSTATIDSINGLVLTAGSSASNKATAYVRRLNTLSGGRINSTQQLLAAVNFESMSNGYFEVGIGLGLISPRVYIEVNSIDVRGVFQNSSGEKSHVVICNTSDVVGDNCIFNIFISKDNTSTATNKGVIRFKIQTDKFEFYKSIKGFTSSDKTGYIWSASAYNVTGQVVVNVGELRLYRE